jgi:XTP/dITP diphosphohydrolase
LYGIDPEAALERTNRKFINRFNYSKNKQLQSGVPLQNLSLDQMNEMWEKAKKKIRQICCLATDI